ncbi:MAG: UDP-N-acetyl-D-galactosamine dehydrogenase [Micavibrio sp.]|nr:UDP-N-acetyl-D-galactosamine dehydrogenase [Micavibrio sp.]
MIEKSKADALENVAVIGLGYVGLPVAVSLSKNYGKIVGFDINAKRVQQLSDGIDTTNEVAETDLSSSQLVITDDPTDLSKTTFYIVAVPTPIDASCQPDLSALKGACEIIAPYLKSNDLVVFESTVYPGVTEEYCADILEQESSLKSGTDFFLGYSPERINPGDKKNTFEQIVKVISAQTPEAIERMKDVYGSAVIAGLFEASSIKAAETAKVIENTQRDLNIALMNELSIICNRLSIRTQDVLKAASTKWNFLNFEPGLVGGHCIGVDPYYLTAKAESIGYTPNVILAGRKINDSMSDYIASHVSNSVSQTPAKIGVWGVTFKENIPDLRHSKSIEICKSLKNQGHNVLIHDPMIDDNMDLEKYAITLSNLDDFQDLDALIISVSHKLYKKMDISQITSRLKKNGLLVDIKSLFSPEDIDPTYRYWSL